MAKKMAEVASLNPAEMLAGGLKSDFRGRVIEAVYAPWDYNGNIDSPVLAAKLTIEDLDAEENAKDKIIEQHWSAGDLAAFVPSQDGSTPTDGDGMAMEPGPYALRVGKRTGLNNNTNFAHLMTSILDAGEASKKFTAANLTAGLDCLEGLVAHWDRVPQKKRSGLMEEGRGGANDILVVTEVFSYRDGKKAAAGKVAPAAKVKAKAKPVDEDEDEDVEEEEDAEVEETLDDRLSAAVLEILAAAPGQKIKKGKLATEILNVMKKDKEKGKAIKRCTETEFLEAGPWAFDEDTGTLSLE